MAGSLASFIHSVVLAPTLEERRTLITDELANMRTFVKDCPSHHRPRLFAKLLWLDTMGCDTAWGQMEVVN
jgi:hypothetical protein